MTEDNSEKYDPIKHKRIFADSNGVFVLVSLLICMVEAILILRLWIKPKYIVDPLFAYSAQFCFLMPAFAVFSLRFKIGKKLKSGEISPSFAKQLCLQLSVLLMLVYIALMQLMNFVSR